MKKLLSMLGAFGLIATSSATVVACGNVSKNEGPSKEDKSKWDAMSIQDFEKLFETAIRDICPSTTDDTGHELKPGDADAWEDLLDKLADLVVSGPISGSNNTDNWTTQNTNDFISLFNAYWTRDKYNLFNYAIDRFKNDDPSYNFLYYENDSEIWGFIALQQYLEIFEVYMSPVNNVKLTVGYSEWDRLMNKIKIN